MDILTVTVLIVVAIVLITLISVNIAKKNESSQQTTTAVLSPTQEHMTEENIRWKMSSMPWNNCLDANKVYCSSALTRQPGGCLKMRSYPKCGASCNGGCPSACNTCVHGTCQ